MDLWLGLGEGRREELCWVSPKAEQGRAGLVSHSKDSELLGKIPRAGNAADGAAQTLVGFSRAGIWTLLMLVGPSQLRIFHPLMISSC